MLWVCELYQYTHTHPAFEVGVSVWGGAAEKKKVQFSNPVTYLRCIYFNYDKIYLTIFSVCVCEGGGASGPSVRSQELEFQASLNYLTECWE